MRNQQQPWNISYTYLVSNCKAMGSWASRVLLSQHGQVVPVDCSSLGIIHHLQVSLKRLCGLNGLAFTQHHLLQNECLVWPLIPLSFTFLHFIFPSYLQLVIFIPFTFHPVHPFLKFIMLFVTSYCCIVTSFSLVHHSFLLEKLKA